MHIDKDISTAKASAELGVPVTLSTSSTTGIEELVEACPETNIPFLVSVGHILRKYWDGPIAVKGVLSVKDAKLAVHHGLDGIIVSNHGDRQLDAAISSLDALPGIVQSVGSKDITPWRYSIKSVTFLLGADCT
ncbi:hypothetical protein MY8738_007950 [Beauveria namnaoensis]